MSEATALTATVGSLATRNLGPAVPWQTALDAFLTARVDSDRTRQNYRRYATEALQRIGREILADVSGMDLAAYRAELLQDGRSSGTHALAVAAMRSFLSWCRLPHVGACPLSRDTIEEALRMPRARVKRPFQVLTDPELREALAVAPTARDRALVGLLAATGLRISELVGLDVGDVREGEDGNGMVHVRAGKGSKDRLVPIKADALGLVRAYLGETGRTLAADGALFRSHDRGAGKRDRRRITARAAQNVIADLMQRVGVNGKRISPHSLRHGYALRYLRNGGNVVALARIMGHASIETTRRYCDHLEIADLAESVPALPV